MSAARRAIRRMLVPAFRIHEARLLSRHRLPSAPPLFIIGVPRSGTTLAYQFVVDQLRMSYICNFAEGFPRTPAAATWLMRGAIRKYRCDFRSSFGHTNGRAAPSEGGQIWNKWFGWGYVDPATISPQAKAQARATVAAIEAALAAPFVNKQPHHSVRMRAMADTFPGCLFLWVRRDPVETAASILTARRLNPTQKHHPAPEQAWWGVRPSNWHRLKTRHYVDQICGQIYDIERHILQDIEAAGPARCVQVWYEDLCARPAAHLEQIRSFMVQRGICVETRGNAMPKLTVPHVRRVTDCEDRMIRRRLKELYSQTTPPQTAKPA